MKSGMSTSHGWFRHPLTGSGEDRRALKGKKDITILDQTATMASVMISSEKVTDYLHLAKTVGRWEIVNALWDYREE